MELERLEACMAQKDRWKKF